MRHWSESCGVLAVYSFCWVEACLYLFQDPGIDEPLPNMQLHDSTSRTLRFPVLGLQAAWYAFYFVCIMRPAVITSSTSLSKLISVKQIMPDFLVVGILTEMLVLLRKFLCRHRRSTSTQCFQIDFLLRYYWRDCVTIQMHMVTKGVGFSHAIDCLSDTLDRLSLMHCCFITF